MFNNNPVISVLIVLILFFWLLMKKRPIVGFYFGLIFYLLCTSFFFYISDIVSGVIFVFITAAYVETARRINELQSSCQKIQNMIRKELQNVLANDIKDFKDKDLFATGDVPSIPPLMKKRNAFEGLLRWTKNKILFIRNIW